MLMGTRRSHRRRIWQPAGMEHRVRPARHEEVGALLAAYQWLFAPPGSQPAQWHPERARETLTFLIDADADAAASWSPSPATA